MSFSKLEKPFSAKLILKRWVWVLRLQQHIPIQTKSEYPTENFITHVSFPLLEDTLYQTFSHFEDERNIIQCLYSTASISDLLFGNHTSISILSMCLNSAYMKCTHEVTSILKVGQSSSCFLKGVLQKLMYSSQSKLSEELKNGIEIQQAKRFLSYGSKQSKYFFDC